MGKILRTHFIWGTRVECVCHNLINKAPACRCQIHLLLHKSSKDQFNDLMSQVSDSPNHLMYIIFLQYVSDRELLVLKLTLSSSTLVPL